MGAVIGDRELSQFRREYYELFSVLFLREPTAELLTALGQNLEARVEAAAALHPLLGEGWREVGQFLQKDRENPKALAAKVAEDFTPLLVGPGIPKITPCESFYLTGKLINDCHEMCSTFIPVQMLSGFDSVACHICKYLRIAK